MSLTSFSFFIFFPLSLLIVWLVPARRQNAALLAVSLAFYACNTPAWLPVLLLSATATWALCRRMDAAGGAARRRRLWGVLAVNIGLLAGLRVLAASLRALAPDGPAARILDALSLSAGGGGRFTLLLPLGISFFTVQSVGYAVDVYRRKYSAEKSLLVFLLFTSFFALISSGPIARGDGLLPQLRKPRRLHTNRAAHALVQFALGFFAKVAVADLLAVFANAVYGSVQSYTGLTLTFGALCYGMQLYFDFAGYSLMALATAELMGLTLPKNFDHPYFSHSVREFWGRWHMSFSSWLRDYIYIPLGGNRRGKLRRYRNLFLTFLVSSLWHGVGVTYLVWGLLQGVYEIVSDCTYAARARVYAALHVRRDGRCAHIWQCVWTFIFFQVSLVFFRAASLGDALYLLTGQLRGLSLPAFAADVAAMAASFNAKPLLTLAFAAFTACAFALGCALECAAHFRAPGGDLAAYLLTRPAPARWLMYYVLVGGSFIGYLMNNGYFASAASFLYNNF